MSALIIFGFYQDGDAFQYANVPNSFGGGVAVWTILAKKYNIQGVPLLVASQVWDKCNKGELNDLDTICCLFTFDGVWVKKENISKLASSLRKFQKEHEDPKKILTVGQVADYLDEMANDDNVIGAAFNMTDVSDTRWFSWNEEADEHLPYNINEGDDHWELFDDFKHIREAVEPPAQHPG